MSLTAVLACLSPMLAPPQAPASFKNVLIASSNGGMQPCEPSIGISRTDPNNIVAGVILDRAIYTRDGGKTWTNVKLTSPFGVHGDPTIIPDAKGNFLYFHLSNTGGDGWIDRIVCQRSTDGGASWSSGVGIGHNPPADQDKQWAAMHPTGPYGVVTWTQFDRYGSRNPEHLSNIRFSLTRDWGQSWSPATTINDISGDCIDSDDTTEGAVPVIGRDNVIHVVWSNGGVIYYDRSADLGKTWLPFDRPLTRHFGGWDMTIPGVGRCNGMPVLMMDHGNGPYKNSLYLLWADQRKGEKDTDILFMRSRDGGTTWTAPMTINKDNSGRHQFFPWLAVDSTTGHVYAVYYDRRSYADNQTDVYLAFSTDGGQTFTERKISEKPFTPTERVFFGDYNNISAHMGVIAPIWTRMDEGKNTVWSAVIKHTELTK